MTLLASKIAEVVDQAIANNEHIAWRGLLDTQMWKVVVEYHQEKNEILIRAKRRDDGSGEPE
jgi:hypothetical protein